MKMKQHWNRMYTFLLSSGLLAAGLLVLLLSLRASGASAYVPLSSLAAPGAYSWNNPINFTHGGDFYDNTPSIAADKTDGTVSIGWTRTRKDSTEAYIAYASNDALGGDFRRGNVQSGTDQQMGNVKLASDGTGRRHMAWWAVDGGKVVGYISIIDANGNASPREEVPGTRGANRKNVAIATGPDNSTHVLFGANESNIYYYHRTAGGTWDVTGEAVPVRSTPVDIDVGVSSSGVVMVAFKDKASPGTNNDIWTTTRQGTASWTAAENASAACCNGCPYDSHTYQPALARDPSGGLRMVWADEHCDPITDPPTRDIYYREWTPSGGWTGHPLVRVVANSGDSYYPDIAVDGNGTAHLIWADTTGSSSNYYRAFYTYGSGTAFQPVQVPADPYVGGSYQKEPSIDVSPGYVHTSWSSDWGDPQKEGYYQYSPTNESSAPCPDNPFKDLCVNGDQASYDAVIALNEQGVLSGYNSSPPCPNPSWVKCFLPGNQITRQQLAKVIALGAALPQNLSGAPHFSDVPPSNAFFEYIESAYNAGAISGYGCGGPGEPCDAQHRGYFRPLNNVTRGQLSKMVATAFEFNEAVSGQSFQDVPPGSPFYPYIERLSGRGIISGYACGGAGEPCGAGSKPYFRPNNNVNRRQAAKIVYGAQQQP